jgi:hypothetical protein
MTKSFNMADKELSDRQKRLIPYLAAAKSIEAGCREAGISDVTFYKWNQSPSFRQALQDARDGLVRESMETLKSHIGKAVQELANLLDAKSPETRRRASVDLINVYMKWRDSVELADRLESIETVIMERRLYK